VKWKTLSKEEIFKIAFISLDKESCELPDGRQMKAYYILHFPHWVNIVAIDKNNDFLLIRQYRHASKEVHWEVPGGAAHKDEDPQLSALRELREETGYTSNNVHLVAENYPNPAIQDNKVYTYLALDCEYEGEQELDPFEEIEVVKIPYKQVEEMLAEGKFNHIICVASLYQALSYWKKIGRAP
jgi:ADP-ribose pyrophosphatase